MNPHRPNANADLVKRMLPIVERMARRQARRNPRADVDELVQVGMVGLLEAAKNHEGDTANSDGYIIRRIHGAILDFLRDQDPLSRRQRRAVRKVEAARQRVEQRIGRQARPSLVAADAGVSTDEYAAITFDAAITMRPAEPDQIRSTSIDPYSLLQERERQDALGNALGNLDLRLRTLVVSHYVEDRPLGELTERFGVSFGRVSQLHKQAVDRLRTACEQAA